MNSRDMILLVLGFVLALGGILGTFFLHVEIGMVALLLIGLLAIVLLVLQRRQMAKVQQRALRLLQIANHPRRGLTTDREQREAVSVKKILGLLQAQQISMELLNDRIEEIGEKGDSQ